MRDKSQHQRWQTQGPFGPANSLGGLSASSLEMLACRQLQQMEGFGALFAEKVTAPLLIKNTSAIEPQTAQQ